MLEEDNELASPISKGSNRSEKAKGKSGKKKAAVICQFCDLNGHTFEDCPKFFGDQQITHKSADKQKACWL